MDEEVLILPASYKHRHAVSSKTVKLGCLRRMRFSLAVPFQGLEET